MVKIAEGRVPDDVERCTGLWIEALNHRDGSVNAHAVEERMLRCFRCDIVRFSLAGEPFTGFALTVARDDGSSTAVLERLAVCPQHERHGIGRTLLQDAIDAARESGYLFLELAVRTGNDAVHLYESAGFVAVSDPIPHELGGAPMVTYRLELA